MQRQRQNIGFIQAAPAVAASGPAAPFVAAALIAAPFVMKLFQGMARGCGQTCQLTADAANQIEAQLKANLTAYMNSGRTRSEQAAALQVFDAYWNSLVEYCSQPEFQTTKAGRNCIEDRKEGACKWKDSGGQCWNWFVGYRDPIAADPEVKPDPPQANPAQEIIDAFTGAKGETPDWLLPAALVIAALAL